MSPAQAPSPEGPHDLPRSEQDRVAVDGRRIDNNDRCTVVLIRDPAHRGWVLYPHGVADYGVRIHHSEALRIAGRITGEDDT